MCACVCQEKEKDKEKEAHPSTSPGPPETRKEHRPSSLKRSGDTVVDTKDTDLFTVSVTADIRV